MQITNSPYSNYNQNTVVSKTENSSENSFSLLLNQEKELEEKGKYLTYVDQFHYLDSLAKEDRKIIRDILRDDKITIEEMDSLSYEQAEKLAKYYIPQGTVTVEQVRNSPIIHKSNQIADMFTATKLTNDKSFNEAMYKTARELENDIFRGKVFNEVIFSISKALSEETGKVIVNQWEWDINNMNINFGSLLDDVILEHIKAIENTTTKDSEFIKQRKESIYGLTIVQKYYSDLKKENK